MADINAGKITRFEDGSTVTITPDGGSAVNVLNIIGGTYAMTPSVRATLEPDVDRGVLLPDIREGDEQPGSLTFDTKHTADAGVTELYEELVADSTDGYVPSFLIVVDIPDFPGAATGVRHTATKAVRAEAPSITAGDQYDTMIARFISTSIVKSSY